MRSAGVIGLGIMGSAMAANLRRRGFAVHGYDVLASRRRGFAEKSVAEVCERAPVVITSLPSAAALHAVCREISSGIVVETSTLPIADKVRARDALARKGVTLLDCPLSGTGAQAKTGDLVVYGSGSRSAFRRTMPVLRGFSRAQYYVGEFGNGSKMKFVANLLVAIHNVSAGEAFVLGARSGLSRKAIYEVMSNSAGASRMFQVRGPMMVKGNYAGVTMSNRLWQKDMKIIGAFARKLGAATPLFRASAGVYKAALKRHAEEDTAAVCAVLEAQSGIRRRKHG